MTKPHPHAVLDEARLGCRRSRLRADPQTRRGHPHQRGIADRLRRRDEQQRRVWSGRTSTRRRKFSSMPPGNRIALGSPNPPASSCGVKPGAIPAMPAGCPGLGKDLIAHPSVQRRGQGGFEQCLGICVPQALHDEVGQSCYVATGLPGRENQPHRFRTQTASGET